LYEGDFIFAVLLQITPERDARLLPYFLPDGHKMALESLAIQISNAAQSVIGED
jgi:hypothetical protein